MFAIRLRELREKKKISQADMAEILGLSSSAIGMYEQGRRNPDNEMLSKVADYFNVTTDFLLGRTEDPNTKILNKEELPEEWIRAGIESLEVFKELNAADLTMQDLQDIIEAINKIKKRHK